MGRAAHSEHTVRENKDINPNVECTNGFDKTVKTKVTNPQPATGHTVHIPSIVTDCRFHWKGYGLTCGTGLNNCQISDQVLISSYLRN